MQEYTNSFRPVRNERVSRLIENQLKQAIFDKHYPVGGKLPSERELADMFQASRTSIREALRALERSGFVAIKKGVQGGAYVEERTSEPVIESMKDMIRFSEISPEEILKARLIIEPSSASEAAENSAPEDIERLMKINRMILEQDNVSSQSGKNRSRFNIEIARISGNRIIIMMMEVLMDVSSFRMRNTKLDSHSREEIYYQHQKIIDAIEKKDRKEAYKIARKHVLNSYKIIMQIEKT